MRDSYFIKKCVRSFIEVRHLCLIMLPLTYVFVCGYTTNGALQVLIVYKPYQVKSKNVLTEVLFFLKF